LAIYFIVESGTFSASMEERFSRTFRSVATDIQFILAGCLSKLFSSP